MRKAESGKGVEEQLLLRYDGALKSVSVGNFMGPVDEGRNQAVNAENGVHRTSKIEKFLSPTL